jgi:NDP-sugar pyrophosphorylase family protein
LVPVLGVPLLERNLRVLARERFQDIVVAVSGSEPDIGRYVEGPGRALMDSCGAHLEILWERNPRGTIGAAREAIAHADRLLVMNVDNLTTLSLSAFVEFHCERGAAFTIAAHQEPFQIPFGELVLADDCVRQYMEKPVKPIWISSGTYVLSKQACEYIPLDERMDAPKLVARLLASGCPVAAYRHQADWIDVNDLEAVKRAERQLGAS